MTFLELQGPIADLSLDKYLKRLEKIFHFIKSSHKSIMHLLKTSAPSSKKHLDYQTYQVTLDTSNL